MTTQSIAQKLKSAILGGRRLPKPAPQPPPLTPAEARAVLEKFAATLQAMQAERDASDQAHQRLAAAQAQDLAELWQAGDELPDLTGLKLAAENATLRARAATQCANALVASATPALGILGNGTREKLTATRDRLEADIRDRIKSVGLAAGLQSVRDALACTPEGQTLYALENSCDRRLSIPVIFVRSGPDKPDPKTGRPVPPPNKMGLPKFRTTPIPRSEMPLYYLRDPWSPAQLADAVRAFLRHNEAVDTFAESVVAA